MIADNEKWHYCDVEKLSSLFCKVTSKHDGHFYFQIVSTHLGQKINLKKMKMYVKIMNIAIQKCLKKMKVY